MRDLQGPVRNGLVAVTRTTRTPRHIGVAPEEGRVGGSTPRGARAQLHIPAAGALPSEAVGFDSPVGLLVGTYLLDASEGAPTPTAALPRAPCHDSNPPCVVCVQATQLVSALLYSAARLSALDSAAILGDRPKALELSLAAPRAPAALRPTYARSRAVPREALPAAAAAALACRHPRLPPPPLAATIQQRSSNGSRHERADQQTTTTRHRRLRACRRASRAAAASPVRRGLSPQC